MIIKKQSKSVSVLLDVSLSYTEQSTSRNNFFRVWK